MTLPFCAKCGRKLIADGDEASCLTCGWRPGTSMADPTRILDSISPGALAESARAKAIGIDKQIAQQQRAIADLREEQKRWLRLADALQPQPKPVRAAKAVQSGTGYLPDEARWKCSKCGWMAPGKFPGRHATSLGSCAGAVNANRAVPA